MEERTQDRAVRTLVLDDTLIAAICKQKWEKQQKSDREKQKPPMCSELGPEHQPAPTNKSRGMAKGTKIFVVYRSETRIWASRQGQRLGIVES